MSPLRRSMQSSEGGSDTTTSVAALRTSSSAQAPVVQPVPASQQVGVMPGRMGKSAMFVNMKNHKDLQRLFLLLVLALT